MSSIAAMVDRNFPSTLTEMKVSAHTLLHLTSIQTTTKVKHQSTMSRLSGHFPKNFLRSSFLILNSIVLLLLNCCSFDTSRSIIEGYLVRTFLVIGLDSLSLLCNGTGHYDFIRQSI